MVKALIKRVLAKFRPKASADKKPSASHASTQASHSKPAHAPKPHEKASKPHGGEAYRPSARSSHPDERRTEDRRPDERRPGSHSGPRRGHGQGGRSHPRHDGPREHTPQHTEKYEHKPDAPFVPSPPWDPASYPVEPQEGKTRFADLNFPTEVLHAIADLKFTYCTPIQAQVLPHTLAGKDAYGRAQTGTGKTAAFLLTILSRALSRPLEGERKVGMPRALILAPTRELVIQIEKDAKALAKYTPIRIVAVYGGMDYDRQRRLLADSPVDIMVATPGRLLDFKQRGDLHLSKVEFLVIDEADRMLDMGFIPDVRQIVHSTPHKGHRQTLFFTATLTDDVKRLASQWTTDPVTIEVAPTEVAVDTVDQVVYIVTIREKFALLYNILMRENAQRVILFANRRDEADRLCEYLRQYDINTALLSGAVPQQKRLRVLEDFKEGKIRVLVATDVAGRGIHVDNVSHVINFNLPIDAEDYVHRIGRTGRAGNAGTSISFADEDDGYHLPEIEKYIGRALKCIHPEDEWLKLPAPTHAPRPPRRDEGERPHGGGGRRPGGPGRGGPRGGGRGGPRGGGGRRPSR